MFLVHEKKSFLWESNPGVCCESTLRFWSFCLSVGENLHVTRSSWTQIIAFKVAMILPHSNKQNKNLINFD